MREKPESTALMEPMMPPEGNPELSDLAVDLIAKSERLAGMLPAAVQTALGDLVRSMNCYYSNLIEGHNTHPRDIDRALAKDYSNEPTKRSLQKEAVAHIEVQRMIDRRQDPQTHPAGREYLTWLHRSFCERLPEDMLEVQNPDTREAVKVVPGELRRRTVVVGRHVPPRPENLHRFLARFEKAYTAKGLPKTSMVVAVGAAHHRLLWIHPFTDGNGRVTRLMSYAMLLRLGVGTPLWSVARGLARQAGDYKALLEGADARRANDLDGRGTLSESALTGFCRFFLKTCIDQIEYMTSMVQPNEFLNRMKIHIQEEIGAKRLPKGSFELLREAFVAGEFERGRAAQLTGFSERWARETLSTLLEKKLLTSDGPKKAVRLALPVDVVERWLPLLYPPLKD